MRVPGLEAQGFGVRCVRVEKEWVFGGAGCCLGVPSKRVQGFGVQGAMSGGAGPGGAWHKGVGFGGAACGDRGVMGTGLWGAGLWGAGHRGAGCGGAKHTGAGFGDAGHKQCKVLGCQAQVQDFVVRDTRGSPLTPPGRPTDAAMEEDPSCCQDAAKLPAGEGLGTEVQVRWGDTRGHGGGSPLAVAPRGLSGGVPTAGRRGGDAPRLQRGGGGAEVFPPQAPRRGEERAGRQPGRHAHLRRLPGYGPGPSGIPPWRPTALWGPGRGAAV